MSCAVFGCCERPNKQPEGTKLHLHTFPCREKSPKRFKRWVRFCRRDNFTPSKSTRICSKHFKESDYDPSQFMKQKLMPTAKLGGPKLKPGVIPSIPPNKATKHPENSWAKRYEEKERKEMADNVLISSMEPCEEERMEVDPNSDSAVLDSNPDGPDFIDGNFESDENSFLLDDSANESKILDASACSINIENLNEEDGSGDSEIEDKINSNEDESFQEKDGKNFDYFLVSWVCILQLFEVCTFCHENVKNVTRNVNGTALTVKSVCDSCGAERNWCSQPMYRKRPEGNILITSALLLSGILYSSFECMCSVMKMPFMSHTTFYKILNDIVTPCVKKFWSEDRASNLKTLKSSTEPVWIAGDGQFDSPGYSAKYCIYSAMDVRSKKIVDFELVQKGQIQGELERPACERLVNKLVLEENCDIKLFLSDRHKGVRCFLRTKHPKIEHEFDVWHLSKNLMKKFKEHEKKFPKIHLWKASINNHLWWCAQTYGGDGELLVERFSSLLNHISNRHEWKEGGVKKECMHEPLSRKEIREKLWLKKNSEEFQIIQKIINDKNFKKDLAQIKHYVHTNELELYHNLRLKYAPKRIHFSFEGMYLRSIIAILDYNFNLERKAISEKAQYSKPSGTWLLKTRYKSEDNSWKKNIVENILAVIKSKA